MVFDTPLERYFQDIYDGVLQAPKFLNFELVNPKNKNCSCVATANHDVKTMCIRKIIAVFFFPHSLLLVATSAHPLFYFEQVVCPNILEYLLKV